MAVASDAGGGSLSFSSFRFQTIGRSSLLSRISDRVLEDDEDDEDDLYVDMDVDSYTAATEPPNAQPKLLERLSDPSRDVDFPGSTFLRSNRKHLSPAGPTTPSTALITKNDSIDPAPSQSVLPKRKALLAENEDCTEDEKQCACQTLLFRSPRSLFTNLTPSSERKVHLPTPPSSGSWLNPGADLSLSVAGHLDHSPRNSYIVPLSPFSCLTRLVQEEQDAWSEVLQAKDAYGDTSLLQSPQGTDIRGVQVSRENDNSPLLLSTTPDNLPEASFSRISKQGQLASEAVSNPKGTSQISNSTGGSTQLSEIATVDTALVSSLNASPSIPEAGSRSFTSQDEHQDHSFEQNPSSPREQELKNMLKTRARRRTKSPRTPDDRAPYTRSRINSVASKHQSGPANLERVSGDDLNLSANIPTRFSITHSPVCSDGSPSENCRSPRKDGSPTKPAPESLFSNSALHSRSSRLRSESVGRNSKRFKPVNESTHGDCLSGPDVPSTHPPSPPLPTLGNDQRVQAAAIPPSSQDSSSTSSTGSRRQGVGNFVAKVKEEEGVTDLLRAPIGTLTRVKKEEEEDIKIPVKMEEDSGSLAVNSSASQTHTEEVPKKEEDDMYGIDAQELSADKPGLQINQSEANANPKGQQQDEEENRDSTASQMRSNADKDTVVEDTRFHASQAILSRLDTSPVDLFAPTQEARPSSFSGNATADISSSASSHNTTVHLSRHSRLCDDDNSRRNFSPRRGADSRASESSRIDCSIRQRSRSHERRLHLSDHWSPPRNSVPRPRPIGDSYRPPTPPRGREPRNLRDDFRGKYVDTSASLRRPWEDRVRFSPPFRSGSPSPRRTGGSGSPPHRNSRTFDTRSSTSFYKTGAATPRLASPQKYKVHGIPQDLRTQDASSAAESMRDSVNRMEHNEPIVHDLGYGGRDAGLANQDSNGLACIRHQAVLSNSTHKPASQDRCRASSHDSEVGKNSVNEHHAGSENGEGMLRTANQACAAEKTDHAGDHTDSGPSDISTRGDSRNHKDGEQLNMPSLNCSRVGKDDHPAPNVPDSSRIRSEMHNPTEKASILDRLSSRPSHVRPAETEICGEKENVDFRSLAARISKEPVQPVTQPEDSKVSSLCSSPQSPPPSLSSRLGDILIDDGEEHPKSRVGLGSRITTAKSEIRQPRHPLPAKPVPSRWANTRKGRTVSTSTINEDFHSTDEAPALLKRMRSSESEHNEGGRPVKQIRATRGRGRMRGSNHSPQRSVHASALSKLSFEDRIS